MKQEKVEAIMEAAQNMFARYGLQKTSMDEIARRARVAKATIYNYFGTKDNVYLEVLRREADEIITKVSSLVELENNPVDKLITFVKAKFQHTELAVNILNLDREGREKVLSGAESIRNGLFEREVDIIRSILQESVEKGIVHLRDVLLTAKAVSHALKGFELTWLVQKSDEGLEYYLDELMEIIFYGLMSENRGVTAETI